MAVVQVPPAVGTSGQFIDSIVVTSSTNRQIIVIGSPTSTSQHAAVDAGSNLQVISASSGVVQVLTTGTYIVTGTVSLSSGTVTLSSNPTVISASSGVVQVLTSGTLIVAMTSGVVTLSSAIAISSGTITLSSATSLSSGTVTLSSNPTVIAASSGNVGTFASTGTLWTVFTFNASSSNSVTAVTTESVILHSWNTGSQVSGVQSALKLYEGTAAPTVGSTTNLKIIIPIPGSTAGSGNNKDLPQGVLFSSGLTIVVTQNFGATSTGTSHSAGEIVGSFYYV